MAVKKSRRYSFQQYMAEAQVTPFILDTTGGPEGLPKEIVIQVPDGDTFLSIADNQQNPRVCLELIAGTSHQDLMKLIGPAPAPVLNDVMQDLMHHFGLAAARPGDTDAP